MPYKVILLGLGNVGFQYDEGGALHSSTSLTHAAALHQDPLFSLIAAIDPNPDLRRRFTQKYGIAAYAHLNEAGDLAKEADLFIIATPTPTHKMIFDTIIDFEPQLIIFEKPLTENIEELEQMMATLKEKKSNAHILINYFRRFSPAVARLKKALEAGDFGEVLYAQIYYCRGFLNNCSHFIDLLSYLFGPLQSASLIDFYGNFNQADMNMDIKAKFLSGLPLQCKHLSEKHFFSGRIYIYTAKGVFLIDEQGKIQFAQTIQSDCGDQVPDAFITLDEIEFKQPFKALLNEVAHLLRDSKLGNRDSLDSFKGILEQFDHLKGEVANASH